jgi:hypothetical protein
MSRFETPLQRRTLQTTGETVLWAELVLSIKTNRGTWEEVRFRVDSGTEMTTMPAFEAKGLDFPIPRRPVPRLTHVQSGLEIRAGLLRARIVGMDATEHVFPCYFLGDPDAPSPSGARTLLGLSGVINQIRVCFDGSSSSIAPQGSLVVETV